MRDFTKSQGGGYIQGIKFILLKNISYKLNKIRLKMSAVQAIIGRLEVRVGGNQAHRRNSSPVKYTVCWKVNSMVVYWGIYTVGRKQ